VFTYGVVHTPFEFYIVAFLVGLVMGGVQALSRSTYSKYLPETEDHTSFFSFYDVIEKLGMILGTISFGMISQLTGGMRNSILSLIVFFIIGLIVMFPLTRKKKLEL
jgi:UMF1 family MFS transporter